MNKVNIVLAGCIALTVSANAMAGGFVGDLIDNVAPGVGTALNRLNHDAGRPFDHAVAGALEAYVPGAGTALETSWAIRDQMGRTHGVFPGQASPQIQQPMLGNFCQTPAGRFGPGPLNPVGTPCNANTPFGLVWGHVTR